MDVQRVAAVLVSRTTRQRRRRSSTPATSSWSWMGKPHSRRTTRRSSKLAASKNLVAVVRLAGPGAAARVREIGRPRRAQGRARACTPFLMQHHGDVTGHTRPAIDRPAEGLGRVRHIGRARSCSSTARSQRTRARCISTVPLRVPATRRGYRSSSAQWDADREWSRQSDLAAWPTAPRLNPSRGLSTHLNEPRVQQAMTRFVSHVRQATSNLRTWSSVSP